MTTARARRRRVLSAHQFRHLVALSLAGFLLFATLGGCLQQDATSVTPDPGPQVLGIYRVELDGIGTTTMSTSIERVDGDGDVERSGLDSVLISGIGFSNITTGRADEFNEAYAYFTALVTPPSEVTNLTFVAVERTGLSISGTAFEEVETDPLDDPKDIAPTITPAVAPANNQFQLADVLANLSTVAFDPDDLSGAGFPFSGTNAVFPYGFVVTAADKSLSRTISGENSGLLHVGFKVPEDTTVTRLVVWMAAVEGLDTRLALPPEYTGRDNMTTFFDHLGQISVANPTTSNGEVTAVLLGPGNDDRDVVSTNADAWRDANGNVDIIDKLSVVALDGGDSVNKIAVRFTSPGSEHYTFNVPDDLSVDYLIVGGGGGGGGRPDGEGSTGGGGAGGVLHDNKALTAGAYPITVGQGGLGGSGTGSAPATQRGQSGQDSVALGETAHGGGGGGGVNWASDESIADGRDGGSGGGAGSFAARAGTPGSPIDENQGNDGGTAFRSSTAGERAGGGGGGAGEAGGDAQLGQAGAGGDGTESSITGAPIWYGGGGGGASSVSSGLGGDGGGGDGRTGGDGIGGEPNTGGGGGAGDNGLGGDGGSGVVVVRFEYGPGPE